MIWTEKYKPKELTSITGNSEIIKNLSNYTLENVPNIIFHGVSGAGKRTLVTCFIKHLFGVLSAPKIKKIEVKTASKTIEVSYTEADEYIEISPSEYGFQDKLIIQSIIKEMAQSKPIMTLFSQNKKASLKIIVITSAECLSQEAQAALRRTIEVYSTSFRVFLICSQLSKIIEPIRSRFLFYRLKSVDSDEVVKILKSIADKEEIPFPSEDVEAIVEESKGNLRKAIVKFQLACNILSEGEKRPKTLLHTKLDWEKVLDEITSKVKNNQTTLTIQNIRNSLYLLINSCVPANFILSELYKRFIEKKDIGEVEFILDLCLKYEERIQSGNKPLFHIEAFIIGVMCVFKKINIPIN